MFLFSLSTIKIYHPVRSVFPVRIVRTIHVLSNVFSVLKPRRQYRRDSRVVRVVSLDLCDCHSDAVINERAGCAEDAPHRFLRCMIQSI